MYSHFTETERRQHDLLSRNQKKSQRHGMNFNSETNNNDNMENKNGYIPRRNCLTPTEASQSQMIARQASREDNAYGIPETQPGIEHRQGDFNPPSPQTHNGTKIQVIPDYYDQNGTDRWKQYKKPPPAHKEQNVANGNSTPQNNFAHGTLGLLKMTNGRDDSGCDDNAGTSSLTPSVREVLEDLENESLTRSGSESEPEADGDDPDETKVKRPISVDSDIPPSEMEQLLQQIQTLRQEQEELKKNFEAQKAAQERLKTRQSEHDRQLQQLVRRQPSFKARIQSVMVNEQLANKHCSVTLRSPTGGGQNKRPNYHRPPVEQIHMGFNKESERIYIQVEELYRNWQRLNVFKIAPDSLYCEIGENLGRCSDHPPSYDSSVNNQEDNNNHLLRPSKDRERIRSLRPSRSSSLYDSIESVNRGRPLPVPPAVRDETRPHEVTFSWSIHDFEMRYNRERQRPGTKTETPPFYFYHTGYRAKLEAYLNGNGEYKNQCMSVFLRIVPGEYDNYLQWPLNAICTFMLVDQSDNYEQSLKSTMLSRQNFWYLRPGGMDDLTSDPQGLLKFVKLEVLRSRNFIKDDCIELRLRVKFGHRGHLLATDME